MKHQAYWFIVLVLLAAVSVACASAFPTATPLPGVTVPPTQVVTIAAPQPSPTATPLPSVVVLPTQIATAAAPPLSPTPIPTVVIPQSTPTSASPIRITFPPGGTSATLQGTLVPNGMDRYILRALAGQTMIVSVLSSKVPLLLQIAGVDGNPLKTFGAGSPNWSGTLPTTQDYVIGIIAENASAATYTLSVAISPLAPPTPGDVQPQRIQFAQGATSATIQSRLALNAMDVYVLRALAGQTMSVNVSSPAHVLLSINGADGDVLKSSGAGTSNWSGRLRQTQDYFIRIHTEDGSPANYTLQITIPPLTP